MINNSKFSLLNSRHLTFPDAIHVADLGELARVGSGRGRWAGFRISGCVGGGGRRVAGCAGPL